MPNIQELLMCCCNGGSKRCTHCHQLRLCLLASRAAGTKAHAEHSGTPHGSAPPWVRDVTATTLQWMPDLPGHPDPSNGRFVMSHALGHPPVIPLQPTNVSPQTPHLHLLLQSTHLHPPLQLSRLHVSLQSTQLSLQPTHVQPPLRPMRLPSWSPARTPVNFHTYIHMAATPTLACVTSSPSLAHLHLSLRLIQTHSDCYACSSNFHTHPLQTSVPAFLLSKPRLQTFPLLHSCAKGPLSRLSFRATARRVCRWLC